MRTYRYASHVAVLLVGMAISGYSAIDLNGALAPRAVALTADAANTASGGGQVGDFALGRDSTIIKPLSIPTSALPNRSIIRYVVKQGDTLESVEKVLGVSLREITWSNPRLKLPLTAGQALFLPPVPGVVVVVKRSDTAASLATAYGADPTIILGFNDISGAQLTPGSRLVIPIDPLVGPNLGNGAPADPVHPGELLCPIHGAPIIQKFGPTSFELEPSYAGYLHFHSGVDLLAAFGTPIQAAAGGKVTAVGFADYFGLRVEVTDSYGLVEIYAHMSNAPVNVGDLVQQGQTVGFVGSTGLSIGSHLHLQLEVGGVPTDPGPLIGC